MTEPVCFKKAATKCETYLFLPYMNELQQTRQVKLSY